MWVCVWVFTHIKVRADDDIDMPPDWRSFFTTWREGREQKKSSSCLINVYSETKTDQSWFWNWSKLTPKLKLIKVGPKTETRALPSLLLLWKIWQGQNFDCNVHISTSARDPEIQLVLYFCNVSTHDICHSTGTIVHQSVSLIHNTQEGQRTWQH